MTGNRLAGHVAFVTGAASGIGRATTIRFGAEGAKVIAVDRDGDRAKETAQLAHSEVLAVQADVTSSAEVEAAVAQSRRTFGCPTILINAAGTVGNGGAIEDMTEDDWEQLFDVNVKGTFLCIKHIVPLMRSERRGSVVNISSTAGLVGSAALGGYSASKGAVVLLSRSLAIRCAPDQVRVNCVCPGSIDTPMLWASFDTAGSPEARAAMAKQYLEKQHLGRFGRAEEVAAAVLFLASDEASFITGVALPVDGGRIA